MVKNKGQVQFQPVLAVILLAGLILIPTGAFYALANFSVSATVETQAFAGDHDDPAIWIHPSIPAQSMVIGTLKGTGLAAYNMNGTLVQLVSQDGGMNNVDLRYNFPLGNQRIDLVVAANRFSPINTLAMYRVNPNTRKLENVTAVPPITPTVSEVYGTCMYVSPDTNKYYAFITSKEGLVEQWELFDNGAGKVTGALKRTIDVGSQTEGCVADDVSGDFYAAEEDVGIWKYGAEPGDGSARTAVDSTGPGGHLTADVEGLAIYYTNKNSDPGYLLASSQGASEYVIYERRSPNNYIATFDIVPGNGIDGTFRTDGIDVTNVFLGPAFSQGVFIAHDGEDEPDDDGETNFKLVPWSNIVTGTTPPLTIDTSWDPRLVGRAMVANFVANVTFGSAPLTVNFTNLSMGEIDKCLWLFGDGGHSASCDNPTHTYTEDGRYTVSLAVIGPASDDFTSRPGYIEVGDFDTTRLPLILAQ